MTRTSMGNVIEDLTKLSPEEKEKYAEQFCEGNKDLKMLLLKMWNNGIQTYASCAGHKMEEMISANGMIADPNPYIYFEVSSLNEKQQQKLFKNLIMISKNLGIVETFDLTLDTYMGFEKHGLSIGLKNSEFSYRVLNDLFDDILKKETVIDKVKKFLIKKDKNDGLTEEELAFVKSLIEFNAIGLSEYLEGCKDFKDEEKVNAISLEFDKMRGKFFSVSDGVKSSVCGVKNEIGNYWVQIAEGMYSKDPHQEDVFYTLENNDSKELKKSELGDLKEFIDLRDFNYSTFYYVGAVKKVLDEINRVVLIKNSNEI